MQTVQTPLLEASFQKLSRTLKIRGPVLRAIRRVESELRQKGLTLPLKYWISTEWFTPDSTVGVAIPFYVLRQDLTKLEAAMVGRAEGATYSEALRILRHEIAHVLDNAYDLRRLRRRQQVFGRASRRYPTKYSYRPADHRFVSHLEGGYAQAHPCEDFAETFAVWLNPRSGWRRKYAGTPALQKLLYVDQLMTELSERPMKKRGGPKIDSLGVLKGNLAIHYQLKTRRVRRVLVRERLFLRLKEEVQSLRDQVAVQNQRSLQYNPDWKSKLIRQVSIETGRHPELVLQYIEKVQKQAKRQGVNLNRLVQVAYPKTRGILVQEAKAYFRQGRHQILL